MARTILRKILSKTKVAALQVDQPEYDPSSTDMTTITSQKISFEEPTQRRKTSQGEVSVPSMQNTRKHSYASVREESNVPQSFRTRRPSHESDQPEDYLPRGLDSLTDLHKLHNDPENDQVILDDASDVTSYSSERAWSSSDEETAADQQVRTIEDLPDEILDQIFNMMQLETDQSSFTLPRADLFSCLLVSKALHAAALRVLYKHVLIYRSRTFHKLVTSVEEDHTLGRLIQTLDFSHYSHMGYGRSRGQTSITPYLTKDNLKAVLGQTRTLKAFLVHEHLDDELDLGVLSALFSIPSLRAADFTSCASETFVTAFSNVWTSSLSAKCTLLKRLCLHECTTLKPFVFESILPRLTQLTHLDVAHTRISDVALRSIPTSARITHLNLERCTQITGDTVVRFLTEHPAARDTMVWLNLNADASRYRLLSAENLNTLLPALPRTLRALNLGGARIVSEHAPALRILATHLEELGLKGANLGLSSDINQILSLPSDPKSKLDSPHIKSTLRYIDLTDITSVNQMSLCHSPISITDNHSLPLEVIELGAQVLTEIARRNKNVKDADWTVKELGRRGWYVRSAKSLPSVTVSDDGHRNWKMGARWWGMRKLPMVEQEVGGMYGYFMFKRN